MGEKIPTIPPSIIELLEPSDNPEKPIPDGALITLDLPNEFLWRLEFSCRHNPRQFKS
jgi:hypothetical protein